MVPGCKQLLHQVDASSALKRKGRKSVTNGPLASFVLASTAVIIPHFHAGTFFFLASCAVMCISAISEARPVLTHQ